MSQLTAPSPRRRLARAAAIVASATVVLTACAFAGGGFTWNLSPSLPQGLYRLAPASAPTRGSTLLFPPPPLAAAVIASRRYLPPGTKLLKTVAALPGDRVDIDANSYRVNGREIGAVASLDSAGRPLQPFLFSATVSAGYAFVATGAPLSFDSRYWGPIPLSSVTVVVPVWTY